MILWIASYPKSGNTWLRALISSYYYSKDGVFSESLLPKIDQFPTKKYLNNFNFDKNVIGDTCKHWIKAQEEINKEKKIRFFKTHNAFGKINNYDFTNKENSIGCLYIVRDPRNVFTSIKNHYHINDFDDALKFILNEKNCIGFAKNNKITENVFPTIISSWKSHYNSWKKVNKNYLLIKYENLLNNPETEFKKISSYVSKFLNLSFDENKILNSIKTNSFENLKIQEEEGKFNEKVADDMSKKDFFYLGKRNNWRELLNKNYIDEINREFKTEMKELGYI